MIIYVDMDGVLSDLEGWVNTTFHTHVKHGIPMDDLGAFKPMIAKIPSWWDDMPEEPGAARLISFIKSTGIPWEILTAYADWSPQSRAAKPRWCLKHFSIPSSRVNTVKREEKKDYAIDRDGSQNILIDDYLKNIEEFRRAGGIGIHHTDTPSTIEKLKYVIAKK